QPGGLPASAPPVVDDAEAQPKAIAAMVATRPHAAARRTRVIFGLPGAQAATMVPAAAGRSHRARSRPPWRQRRRSPLKPGGGLSSRVPGKSPREVRAPDERGRTRIVATWVPVVAEPPT